MTGRDRVSYAIQCQGVDRVPQFLPDGQTAHPIPGATSCGGSVSVGVTAWGETILPAVHAVVVAESLRR